MTASLATPNRHDATLEAVMTGAFVVVGPIAAVLGAVAGAVRSGRRTRVGTERP